jgi:hypothetical protein
MSGLRPRRPTPEELERWGQSLREIDPSTLAQDEKEGPVRWFLGDDGTELFVWQRPDSPPHHLQLVFARVSVDWDAQKGLVTGSFDSMSATAGGRFDAYLLTLAALPDPAVCNAALLLLAAAPLAPEIAQSLMIALERVALAPERP